MVGQKDDKSGTFSMIGNSTTVGISNVACVMTTDVVSVAPNALIENAIDVMIEHAISGLPVIDDQGKLVGLISEYDALNLLLEPPSEVGLVAPVVSFMTRDVVTIPLDTPLDTAAHMMQAAGLRRLPVVDGDRVVGIVSRRDLMRVVREMRRQSNFEMLPDAEFAD
jgi:CBS domain-containing protein